MMQQLKKYPRTHHIEGSRLQPGDEDLESVPLASIANRHVVIEEKVDGANCGISFSHSGELQLQSRGHYLTGGPRERHFDLLKQWAAIHSSVLWDRLGDRYILYGEWLYAKHTVFYDQLPHYLLEFDILDSRTMTFLDTPQREVLLNGTPVHSVRVLYSGVLPKHFNLRKLVVHSGFISDQHLSRLQQHAEQRGLDPALILRETDRSPCMEGLYIKVEEEAQVQERYKFVRPDFLTTVVQSETHWLDRPIVPNLLEETAQLFGANE